MGRKKVEINPKSGERLSSLLKEHGMTQKALADALGYTPQQISRIVNGKERLTEDFACKVRELFDAGFDTVRSEWLTGNDDFKTETDRINLICDSFFESRDIIQRLIELHGYEVTVDKIFTVDRKGTEEEQWEKNRKALTEWCGSSCYLQYPPGISDEEALARFHNSYPEAIIKIKNHFGGTSYIERCEYSRIIRAIDDFVEMQMSFLFRKRIDGTKAY